jgi:hypothetical protein
MRLLILLIISLTLAACATKRVAPIEDVRWQTKWFTYDCGKPPARDIITFAPIPLDWWWVTEQGDYVLASNEYAQLGESMQEIIKGARQLRQEIKFYEDCIAEAQRLAEMKNGEQ